MPAKKTDEKKPFKPAMREMRLPAIAERLDLPVFARNVYQELTTNLSAAHSGVHLDRVVDWFTAGYANDDDRNTRAIEVCDAVLLLEDEGLITTEPKMTTANGETQKRIKIKLCPVEAWTNDRHFLAAISLRLA